MCPKSNYFFDTIGLGETLGLFLCLKGGGRMAIKRTENGERDSKGRFVPGYKGGGRKKIPQDVRDMFKAATPAAAKLLIKTIDDEDAPLAMRMDAAKTVLDRVYGKATQPIDGSLDATLQIVMTDEVRELMG